MEEKPLRIVVEANLGHAFTAMFEPTGMTYELSDGEVMYADVVEPVTSELRIISWNGGISIWPPGSVITRNAAGEELDRLN